MKNLKGADLKNVLDSDETVAIFYYMNSCPHCKVMHGPWSELEKEEPNVKFCKIESSEIPSDMGITGFPHFQKRSKKKVDKEVGGEMSKEDLKKKLFGGLGGKRTRRRRSRRLTRRGRKVRK
jgi:thiol-disulfide isomerase/thioredoxin